MRNEEEVELSINDLGLLNEAMVNIGTLRWVQDLSLVVTATLSLLEESLSDTFVHDDESNVGKRSLAFSLGVVLVS